MELTAKKENFARLVSEGQTYAEAYREAYPTSKKWKNTSVWCESSKLMTDTKVLHRVKEIVEENQLKHHASLEEVLTEMAAWLRFDPIDMINDDGTVKAMSELPPEVRKSIASFEVVELWDRVDKQKVKTGEIRKIKLVDKRATADMILKQMGQYVKKLQVETEDLSHLEELLNGIEK